MLMICFICRPYKEVASQSIKATSAFNDQITAKSALPHVVKDGFLRPASQFPWKEENQGLNKENLKSVGQKTVDMKLSGVIAVELGAHALIKLKNKAGFDLGEFVICLSHLLTTDPENVMKMDVKKVSLALASSYLYRTHCSVTPCRSRSHLEVS
jgi:hypothetical protein